MPRVSLPAALMSTVCLLFLALRAGAETDAYPRATQQGGRIVETRLTIARETVTIAGVTAEAMTVDGGIPGPTLRWRVGDLARVHVENTMDVPSSIHWHGMLLPNRQDGVPGLTTPGIRPGATHTFEIPIRHEGTYWYHSHTELQEQRGVYGAIVIDPAVGESQTNEARAAPSTKPIDRDVVLVLSDWTARDPNEILRLLKRGSEYFSIEKGTAQSLWGALRAGELMNVFRRALQRMPPMDISDVAYDAFLINGRPSATIPARPGERLRVRIVNAAASTYFYLGIGKGPMRIVAADGVDVVPLETDRLLVAIAETYDLVVDVPTNGRVELRATAQDGSGGASAWLGDGADLLAEDVPRPNFYAMRHADGPGHGHDMQGGRSTEDVDAHAGHRSMRQPTVSTADARPLPPYDQLRSRNPSAPPPEAPVRTIRLRLTGNMDRYVWSFDDETLAESDVIPIRRGEVLRVELENTTMMHHPLHLHGHFFRVLGPDAARIDDAHAPLKHTVDVAPMRTTTIEFLADAEQDWLFHCHVLYHMKAGMSRIFHYEDGAPDPALAAERAALFADPVYAWGEASMLSQFSEGLLLASNRRYDVGLEWEIGWSGVGGAIDRELLPRARYHVDRFYRLFAGASLEDERDVAVIGAEALLPLNFDARAWVDTRGHGRFILSKGLDLTPRLSIDGIVEYDTEQAWEGSAGLRFRIHRRAALAAEWHSDFGPGGGIELIW